MGADTIEITMEYGCAIDSLTADNFVLNGVGAEVTKVSTTNVTVTAANKTEKTYKIVEKMRPALTSFEIEGQIGESVIEANDASPYKTTVKVVMPYGTEDDEKIPTFTLGEDIEEVTYADDADTEFVSGLDALKEDNNGNFLTMWKYDVDHSSSQEGVGHFNVVVEISYATL